MISLSQTIPFLERSTAPYTVAPLTLATQKRETPFLHPQKHETPAPSSVLVPSVDAISKLLARLSTTIPLEVMDISQVRLGALDDVFGLLDGILAAPWFSTQMKNVHTLKFNSCELTDQGLALVAALAKQLPNLQTLELFNNQLTDDACGELASLITTNLPSNGGDGGTPSLLKLKLGQNRIGSSGALLLSCGLAQNGCLQSLHLGGNPIGDSGLLSITQALDINTTLTSLCLRDCHLTTAALPALSQALARHSSLTDIQLKGNPLAGWGVQSLAHILTHSPQQRGPMGNPTTFRSRLRTLELQGTGLTEADARTLADAIASNTVLAGVNLNDNHVGDSGVEVLVLALIQNTSVLTLGLRGNRVGTMGSHALARLLISNTPLVGIDLGMNHLGDGGAMVIGQALQYNTNLRSLDLRGNRIGVKGSEFLAQVFATNGFVSHLDLSCNFHRDSGAEAWSHALQQNRSLTRLSLADGEITETGGVALLQALRSNPALCFFDTGGERTIAPVANRLSAALRRAFKATLQEHRASQPQIPKDSHVTAPMTAPLAKNLPLQAVSIIPRPPNPTHNSSTSSSLRTAQSVSSIPEMVSDVAPESIGMLSPASPPQNFISPPTSPDFVPLFSFVPPKKPVPKPSPKGLPIKVAPSAQTQPTLGPQFGIFDRAVPKPSPSLPPLPPTRRPITPMTPVTSSEGFYYRPSLEASPGLSSRGRITPPTPVAQPQVQPSPSSVAHHQPAPCPQSDFVFERRLSTSSLSSCTTSPATAALDFGLSLSLDLAEFHLVAKRGSLFSGFEESVRSGNDKDAEAKVDDEANAKSKPLFARSFSLFSTL